MQKYAGWFFYRWHPEVALRYLPIVEEIKKLPIDETILEVGSGGLGIAPYIGREVTGIDVKFEKPYHPLLKRIKSSALALPFDNSSFTAVVSCDMLEHLRMKDRAKAIDEMMRVAKKHIFIGVPCGKKSLAQDLFLDKWYQKHYHRRYHFLKEQIELGVPEKDEIYAMILDASRKMHKNIRVSMIGNENLSLRLFLMKGWMTTNIIVDIIFRKVFIFFLPILRYLNHDPTYRYLFTVTIDYENSN